MLTKTPVTARAGIMSSAKPWAWLINIKTKIKPVNLYFLMSYFPTLYSKLNLFFNVKLTFKRNEFPMSKHPINIPTAEA